MSFGCIIIEFLGKTYPQARCVVIILLFSQYALWLLIAFDLLHNNFEQSSCNKISTIFNLWKGSCEWSVKVQNGESIEGFSSSSNSTYIKLKMLTFGYYNNVLQKHNLECKYHHLKLTLSKGSTLSIKSITHHEVKKKG